MSLDLHRLTKFDTPTIANTIELFEDEKPLKKEDVDEGWE